jgi:hypothetical protein
MTDLHNLRATNRANHHLSHDITLWRHLLEQYPATPKPVLSGLVPSLPIANGNLPQQALLQIQQQQLQMQLLQHQQQQQQQLQLQQQHRPPLPPLPPLPPHLLPPQQAPSKQGPQLQAPPFPLVASISLLNSNSNHVANDIDDVNGLIRASSSIDCEMIYITRWLEQRQQLRVQHDTDVARARAHSLPMHHLSRSRQPYYPPPQTAHHHGSHNSYPYVPPVSKMGPPPSYYPPSRVGPPQPPPPMYHLSRQRQIQQPYGYGYGYGSPFTITPLPPREAHITPPHCFIQ